MLRPLLFGLAVTLFGCATGGGDLGGFTDGGVRKDTAPAESGGGCGVGLETCDGDCVDLAFDRNHCGSCGNVCKGTEVCKAGKCSSDCGTLTSCTTSTGAKCVNTATDAANCGACGKACPSGQLCSGGSCAPDCGTLTRCPGATPYCADVTKDVKDCGYCGNACPAGQDCVSGVCALTCTAPETKCGGKCTNTSTDPANCGACAVACSLSNATAGCAAGTCTVASCSAGYGNCDGVASNGCETNTSNNLAHCGACGTTCSVANGTPACSGGSCTVASCTSGWGNCDGSASNGCETNTRTSTSHCGSCGNACAGGQTCVSGVCTTVVSGTYNRTVYYSGSGCTVCGSSAYQCMPAGGSPKSFIDPVPSGGRVVSVTVRVYGVGCSAGSTTVLINGAAIGSFSATSNCDCGGCEAPYTVTLSTPGGLPGYVYGGSNSVNVVPTIDNAPCIQRTEIALTAG